VIARWRTEVETKGPDWLAASKLLMAYGWGTPTATLEIGRTEGPAEPKTVQVDPKKLTTAELDAYLIVYRAYDRLQAEASAVAVSASPPVDR